MRVGSKSWVDGAALTLSTAGLESSFRIHSRDAYENDNERCQYLYVCARKASKASSFPPLERFVGLTLLALLVQTYKC